MTSRMPGVKQLERQLMRPSWLSLLKPCSKSLAGGGSVVVEEVSRSFGDFHFSELFELGPTFIAIDTDGSTHESSTFTKSKYRAWDAQKSLKPQQRLSTQKRLLYDLQIFRRTMMLLFATHLENVEERKLRARGASTRSCGDQRTAVPAIPKHAIRHY